MICLLAIRTGEAADSEKVTIRVDGHVKNCADYMVDRHVRQNLEELIEMAGGFAPLAGFESEKTSSVAWIERKSKEFGYQLIIIDYQNKEILSERRVDGKKWRNERYDWNSFEYLPGDVLFVTTSRKSLDLAGYPVRYVEDHGWTNYEKLRYFGKTKEETEAIDAVKKDPPQ